ncbi:MAG TPA: saccharopine dehydrogenase C-terminal domain-containing protein [Chitinophagaceae bacterium]|nr:saccharopine dehydrogenase C-terminal domain-containing protein [Chitinophagaceae bacterium]
MKKILLFGAGKSATVLIDYLLEQAAGRHWQLIVADTNPELAEQKIRGSAYGKAIAANVTDEAERSRLVSEADLVISMLPAFLHALVAEDCIRYAKNLLTASYADEGLKNKAAAIKEKGILFLCEMGLDPGIDHMSAMQLIHAIQNQDGQIISFKSHCGGLVAPESDDNPWHYKISWNPRNIILAGKAGAIYLENGQETTIPYGQLFQQQEQISVDELGRFGWYANRDSLSYTSLYGLQSAETFIRTTLRHPAFMKGWKYVVALQLTDEEKRYDTTGKTLRDLFAEHLSLQPVITIPADVQAQLNYLGMNDDETIPPPGKVSAAGLLQFAAEQKLALQPQDKDMIVMQHEIIYTAQGQKQEVTSTLVVKGENSLYTAMAKTVGLPLGIAAKLILTGQISLTGLHLPILPDIYEPVLRELHERGVSFEERTRTLSA